MAAGNLAEYELLRPQCGDLGAARDHHRQSFEELEHDAFDPRPYPAPKRRPHSLLQTLLLRPRSRTMLLAAALLAIGFSLFVILPPGDRAARRLPESSSRSGLVGGAASPDRVVVLRTDDNASGSSQHEKTDPSPAQPTLPPTADDEADGEAQDMDQTDPEPAPGSESVGILTTGSNDDDGVEPPEVLAPGRPTSEDTYDAPLDDVEVPGTQDDDDDDDSERSPEATLPGTLRELQPTRTVGVTADPAATTVTTGQAESEDEKGGVGTDETITSEGPSDDAAEKAEEAENDDDAAEAKTDEVEESDDAVEKIEGAKKDEDAVEKPEGPEKVDGAMDKAEGPEIDDGAVGKTEGPEEGNSTVGKTGDRASPSHTETAEGDPAVQVNESGSGDGVDEKGSANSKHIIGGTQGPAEYTNGGEGDEKSDLPATNNGTTVGPDPGVLVSSFNTAVIAGGEVSDGGGERTQTVAGSGEISNGSTTTIRLSPTPARPDETEAVEILGSAPESAAATETSGPSTLSPTPHPTVPTVDTAVTLPTTSDDGYNQASQESFAGGGSEPADNSAPLFDSAGPVAATTDSAAAEAAHVADDGSVATAPGAQSWPPPADRSREIDGEEPANDAAGARNEATAVGSELLGARRGADGGRAPSHPGEDDEEEVENGAGHKDVWGSGEEYTEPADGSLVKLTGVIGETSGFVRSEAPSGNP